MQLEHQTRVVLQLQNLLRHGSLAGDPAAASTSESSAVRDQLGAQREEPGQEASNGSGLQRRRSSTGESRAVKDKSSQVNVEAERTEDRTGEQLQNLSRSASPARSALCLQALFYV